MGNVYTKSGALAKRIYFGSVLIWEKLVGSEFIIEVDTTKAGTSNNDQFQFTGAQGDYNVVAKQGGVVIETFNDLSDEATITLPSSGVYVLEVSAKEVNGFTGMRFNNEGDKLKLSKINQWGIFNDARSRLFYNCNNLTEIASDNDWLNSITNGSANFAGCNLTFLPETLTLQNLVDGSSMFNGCNISELPSGMVLNNLQTGDFMFLLNSLTSLNNVVTLENVVDAISMFRGNSLTSLPNSMTLNNLENGNSLFNGNFLGDLPIAITFPNLDNGTNIFNGSTINTPRYSTLLIDMKDGNNNTNVPFHGGYSKYNTNGETERNLLIANQNWSFIDGGLA